MRPLRLLPPILIATWFAAARAAPPPASPVEAAAAVYPAAPAPAPRVAPSSSPVPSPISAFDSWVDSSLADDRRLYWLRCTGATANRRRSRSHALQGMALFLANVPVEYAASRHRHTRGSEPVRLNALGFALLSASFLKLGLANLAWQDYQRDRACCRYWQEFAQISR